MKPDMTSTKGEKIKAVLEMKPKPENFTEFVSLKMFHQWASLPQYVQRWEALQIKVVMAITPTKISFVSGVSDVQPFFPTALPDSHCCKTKKAIIIIYA